MKERDPMSYAIKANEKTLFDIFGPNPSPEVQLVTQKALNDVNEYFGYVHSFVPTVEQPYPLSDTEYFKQKDA
ncbi:hypothetical protein XbC2_378 [Xanthomonas phage XbC2]|nr:hypothetical protein XbC2_378 [Xanthomonas phage XbC2]